jgi:hypothetical protein
MLGQIFPNVCPASVLVLETVPNEDLRGVQAGYDSRRCQWDACVRADYCLSVRHDSESPAAEKDYLTPKQRSAAKSHLLTSMCIRKRPIDTVCPPQGSIENAASIFLGPIAPSTSATT